MAWRLRSDCIIDKVLSETCSKSFWVADWAVNVDHLDEFLDFV